MITQQQANSRGLVIILAVMLDWIFGDPSNRFHPVAWMGTAIAKMGEYAPKSDDPQRKFVFGGLAVLVGLVAASTIARLYRGIAAWFPPLISVLLEAVALKMMLSLRGLVDAGRQVEQPLLDGDIETARQQLSWHLVSRDTSALNESQVTAAAIESIAENASDSLIAPLFFYSQGGLPAVFAYRFLNTMDAMWGYRNERYEWQGKIAARLDDVTNWIPARLTALFITGAAAITEENAKGAWQIWQRDAEQTDSPNAGQPMSAMAGALDVELEKAGQYQLGAGLAKPGPTDIARSISVLQVASILGVILLALFADKIRVPSSSGR
ncbi:MAG: adenosylcobinamide-phosphate synthase CbiB [Chloroflexota bacterium]